MQNAKVTVVSAKTEVTLHETLSFLYKNKFWNPEVEKIANSVNVCISSMQTRL